MKKLLLILLCLPIIGFGQACKYSGSLDVSEICDYVRGNHFASDKNARDALNKILNATKSKQKFAIKECSNISNAVATIYNGINYILYDKEFMNEIAENTNSWSKISILAHEIGHHIYGHTLSEAPSLAISRQWELEADEYSGFVMFQLGVNLLQAQEAILQYAHDGDDTYSTHPNKEKRLKAIEKGWNKSRNSKFDYSTENIDTTVEEYFYKAYNSDNFQYKIDTYTKCIRMSPKFLNAYVQRGIEFAEEGKSESAINDLNTAIDLDKIDANLYRIRANIHIQNSQNMLALNDLSKAISLGLDNDGGIFTMRGIIFGSVGNYDEAIFNHKKAINLYDSRDDRYSNAQVEKDVMTNYILLGEVYSVLENYKKANNYFNLAIEIDNNNSNAFKSRGKIYMKQGKYKKAIKDYTRAISLDPSNADSFLKRGLCYGKLENWKEAIRDFDRLIILKPDDISFVYSVRGLAKEALNRSPCSDFKKSCELGYDDGCEYYYDYCGRY